MENPEFKELFKNFSKIVNSVKKRATDSVIEPFLERALQNFQKEMGKSFEEFKNETPYEMKAYIYDILYKHFILSLTSEKIFMGNDESVSEIDKRIHKLLD